MVGEKCTSIVSDDMGGTRVGCVATGSVQIGGACMIMAGVGDDCIGGAYCNDGTCAQICDVELPYSCEVGLNCTEFDDRDIAVCLVE